MLKTATLTLLALLASAVLTLAGWGSPLAVAHLAFAAGIVPLIFAAMLHFVPVLTRTGDPGRWMPHLPEASRLAGLIAVGAMQGLVPYFLLTAMATVDAVLAAVLLGWIARRARAALGSPHPCWRWYAGALLCLILALAAVILSALMPELRLALRLLHLHLNTLGLVGLAALGTLPVLMPTALGKPDPEAAANLRRRLWPVLGGVALVALGSALAWPLAVFGAGCLFHGVTGLLFQWRRRYGWPVLLADGAAASLLAATCGLWLVLAGGIAHGAGLVDARPTLLGWGVGFLLPLVTGALTQLLPVWRWPGPQIPARGTMRKKLAATGRWRATCFFLGGGALLAGQPAFAGVMLLGGIGLFAHALLQAVRVSRSTR